MMSRHPLLVVFNPSGMFIIATIVMTEILLEIRTKIGIMIKMGMGMAMQIYPYRLAT